MLASESPLPPPIPSPSVFARGAAALLVLLVLAAYANSFSGEFVLDDQMSVADNPSIRRLSDLATVLRPPASSTVGGRPLANLTFALNYALGGTSVRSYHVTNLALHLAAALLLLGLVRRTLLRSGATDRTATTLGTVAAALWATHPVITGAVTYISQRTEILMGLFYLLTLYAFVRGAGRRSRAWFAVSVVACAIGMASKEVMVTCPVIVFLFDRTFLAGSFATAWRERGRWHASLAATWLLLAFLMSGGLSQRAVGFGLGISSWQYALTETQALVRYLRLAVWPHPLVFDYGPVYLGGLSPAVPYLLVLVPLFAAIGFALWRYPKIGFLAAGFFLALAPTSSIVPLATQPIAESRLYLPLAFATVLAAVALAACFRRPGFVVLAALVLANTGLALRRNAVLTDPVLLWRDTLSHWPHNPRAHSNYGAVLFARHQVDRAIAEEREALRGDPNLASAHSNLAFALLAQENYPEALEHALRAIALEPRMPDARFAAGSALLRLSRPAEAIPHFQGELALRPDYAEAHANLGTAVYLLGRPADAIGHFATALRLKPGLPSARESLPAALAQAGRVPEAIALYRQLLQENPAALSVRCNLAITLAQAGQYDAAEAEFATALQLQPDYRPAQSALADLRAFRARQNPTN